MANTTLDWGDKVRVVAEESGLHTVKDVLLTELLWRLRDESEGRKLNVIDVTLDLTSLGAQSIAVGTIPAGALVVGASMEILATVVSGGSTAKVGVGPSGTKNKYGVSGDLLVGTATNNAYAKEIATQESVSLYAVQSDGTTAGGTNISAGSVRVVIHYYTFNAQE